MLGSEASSELPGSLLAQLFPFCGYSSQYFHLARLFYYQISSPLCEKGTFFIWLNKFWRRKGKRKGKGKPREKNQKRGRNFCKAGRWVLPEYAQSCPTLCDPMDCSLPGSTVQGIFQARILEQVAIPPPDWFSWLRNWTHVSCISCIGRWILAPLRHLGKPELHFNSKCLNPFNAIILTWLS